MAPTNPTIRAFVATPSGLAACFCGLLACRPTEAPAAVGCARDTDCKGERVCENTKCVEPAPAAKPEAPAPSQSAPAHDPGWARGGPGGVAPARGVGPTKTPAVKWEAPLGAVIFARPVLRRDDQGRVVAHVGTHGGRFVGVVAEGEGEGSLVSDLTLGGMVWATAAVGADGTLFVGDDSDQLHAIDPVTGEARWSKKLGNCEPSRAPGPEGARCDVDGGPTVASDGDLYVGADGVYRLSPDGEIKWRFPGEDVERPAHVFATPVVTADGVYFGGQDGMITALDPSGKQRWQYKVGADVDGSPAIGIDGTLYVGADDGRVHALRRDGSLKWSFVSQADIRSSIAVARDGTLYVTSFDRNLYSLDPAGNIRWVLATAGRIMSTPVVDADSNVFFGSQDDHLYGVSPKGRVLWSLDLGADVDGTVAITEAGTVVVGADDGVLRGIRG